ncbi:hypothetical protein BDFB_000172, partial [Asbolus verrucosus]
MFYQKRKWDFGKVTEKTGLLHYEVEVEGHRHHRYVDQLVPFHGEIPPERDEEISMVPSEEKEK